MTRDQFHHNTVINTSAEREEQEGVKLSPLTSLRTTSRGLERLLRRLLLLRLLLLLFSSSPLLLSSSSPHVSSCLPLLSSPPILSSSLLSSSSICGIIESYLCDFIIIGLINRS